MASGVLQKDAAAAVGVARTVMCSWAAGRHDIRAYHLDAWAQVFGLRLALVPIENSAESRRGPRRHPPRRSPQLVAGVLPVTPRGEIQLPCPTTVPDR